MDVLPFDVGEDQGYSFKGNCYDPASSLRKRNDVQGKGWLDFDLLILTNGLARADTENNVSRTRTGGSKSESMTTAAEAGAKDTSSDGY